MKNFNLIKTCSFAILCVASFALPSAARAEIITSLSVNININDEYYVYEYLINNESSSTLDVDGFLLDVSPEADLHSLIGPEGWVIFYAPGDTSVAWQADFPFDTLIRPGESGTFSFSSKIAPSLENYLITGINIDNLDFGDNQGRVLSPSVSIIPEPSALLQTGIGIFGLAGGYGWWHRRRRSAR